MSGAISSRRVMIMSAIRVAPMHLAYQSSCDLVNTVHERDGGTMRAQGEFMRMKSIYALLMLSGLLVGTSPALAVTAGSFEFVMGDVRVRGADGRERVVRRGDALEVGEIVVTGPLANAQMRMVDNAFIAVRPDSEVSITDYRYSGRPEQDNVLLRLAKGTLRAFTGAISQSRKDRFQMATPTATVGIRGSGNVLHFSPNLGTLNHTIEGSHAVSSVNAAGQAIGTVITNPGQTVQVFVNQPPVRVPTPTFLIQAATTRPAPAPAPQSGGGQGGGSGGTGSTGGSSASGGGTSSGSGDSGSGTASGSSSGGSTAGGSSSGGAAATTTTGTAAPLRVVSSTDATLGAIVSPVVTAPIVTTITTIEPVKTTTLTGTTSTGGTLNTATSTITSSTGTTTTIAAATTPPTVTLGARVLANYFSYSGSLLSNPFGNNDVYRSAAFDAFDGSTSFAGPNGNFSGFSKTASSNDVNTLSVGGNTAGASTVTVLGNGISFGRYASQTVAEAQAGTGTKLTVSGQDGPNTLTNAGVVGSFHWIQGPGTPLVMPRVLTGTATFGSMVASAPTDQNNIAGSPSNVTATLLYNFDRQSANTSINVTMGPNGLVGGTHNRVWAASGTDLALDDGGGFRADTGGSSGFAHKNLAVTLNGSSVVGSVSGDFTGPTLNGAILSYVFGGSDPLNYNSNLCGGPCHEHVNGVVGFGSVVYTAAPVATAPYYVRLSSMGLQGGFAASGGSAISVGSSSSAANLRERFVYPSEIAILDANRVKRDTSGAVLQYDTTVGVVSTNGTCPTQCNVNETAARVSIMSAGSAAFTASNGALVPAMPSIASTPATVVDFGTDSVTGISWGRYTQGAMAVVDRVNGSTLNANADFGPVNHYLLSGQQTGATVLPATGTATYTFVGGTNPTDTTGAIGTLNSATLMADFGAQKVTASVNATAGGRTWTATTPTAVPILAGVGFEATKSLTGTGNTLSVSCTGSGCQSTVAGQISGVFTGTTGQGAGMSYALNTGGVSGITVGGVAAFKR